LRFAALQSVISIEVADPLVRPRFLRPLFPACRRRLPPIPSPVLVRVRVHPLMGPSPASETRSLVNLSAAREHQTLLLGFLSPSRHQHWKSTRCWAFRAQLRSALSVSHALDGFLLPVPSWACFIPQPRPGLSLQGFLSCCPADSPLGAPSPLVVTAVLLLPSGLDSARARKLAFRGLIQTAVRSYWQRG
jgi:hypothetical protein